MKHHIHTINGWPVQDLCADCGQLIYLNANSDKWAHAASKQKWMYDHPPSRIIPMGGNSSRKEIYA